MNTFNEWIIIDRFPDKKLDEIKPISLRAFSMVSRKLDNFKNLEHLEGAVEIIGALNMMEALDYHYENFIEIGESSKRLHEAVAYINRVGQFNSFIRSPFVNSKLQGDIPPNPKIQHLLLFRNKNTAHRSIDAPRREDNDRHYQIRQALTFISTQRFFDGNHEKFLFPQKSGDNEPSIYNFFCPETDHPVVMTECYEIIERVINQL